MDEGVDVDRDVGEVVGVVVGVDGDMGRVFVGVWVTLY